ncbi:MAG TPA: FkbM family methyltransferase [Candidatus Paceibacterota bacterium]|nr:FkbM family methyltransferase [Candidatus Paceibacterota bacterium]
MTSWQIVAKSLVWLYSFDTVRALKDFVRPLKHALFGKDGIYYVVDEVANVRTKDSPVEIVFDIGAAHGDTARTFGRSFKNAVIYCFEPQETSMQRLKKRTVHLKERIKTFPFAFLNKTGIERFNILSYADASSFLPVQKYFKEQGITEVESRMVQVMKLDDFVREHKIPRIHFMKIDVEGVEKELLQGGSETLRHNVDNVFIEISPLRKGPNSADHIDVFRFFHERNFTLMGFYGDCFFSKDELLLKKYFGVKK